MIFALVIAITLQLQAYYSYPTVINIRESRIDAYDIPEVTICERENLVFAVHNDPWEDEIQERYNL